MARSTLIGVVGVLAACGYAFGDDLTPPPWRFQNDTTFQHWDFSAGPGGGAPDAPGVNLFNPNGVPTVFSPNPAAWLPTFGGRNDVWAVNGNGFLQFDIPNDNMGPTAQKELWLQVTFLAQAPIFPPGMSVTSPNGNFTLSQGPFTTVLANGWVHQLTIWTLPSCPATERVVLTPPQLGATLFCDQVVIDTRCTVPAPGIGALAGAGLVLAARRRRR